MFYSGSSSLGSCDACGSPVHDGGQSGAYCSNNACPNSYFGGRTLAELAEEDERRRLARIGRWSLRFVGHGKGNKGITMTCSAPDREAAVREVERVADNGYQLVEAGRWDDDGEWYRVEDDLR